MAALVSIGGCGGFLDFDARPSVDVFLQVHGEAGGVDGATVQLFHYGVMVARGESDGGGLVVLSSEVDRAAPTTARSVFPWISVLVEKPGFLPLDLPLRFDDFVEEKNHDRLLRGVGLRRAS